MDGLASFSRIKSLENTCKCLYHSKVHGGISFHVMAENCKHLKDTIAISSFLMCSNRNSLANKRFGAQYITGCRSVANQYITSAKQLYLCIYYFFSRSYNLYKSWKLTNLLYVSISINMALALFEKPALPTLELPYWVGI